MPVWRSQPQLRAVEALRPRRLGWSCTGGFRGPVRAAGDVQDTGQSESPHQNRQPTRSQAHPLVDVLAPHCLHLRTFVYTVGLQCHTINIRALPPPNSPFPTRHSSSLARPGPAGCGPPGASTCDARHSWHWEPERARVTTSAGSTGWFSGGRGQTMLQLRCAARSRRRRRDAERG